MSEPPLQPESSGTQPAPDPTPPDAPADSPPSARDAGPAVPAPLGGESPVHAQFSPQPAPAAHPAEPSVVPYADPAAPPIDPHAFANRPLMLLVGGAFGLAACAIGLMVLLLACAGLNGVFKVSWLPLILGGCGFVIALVGANVQKARIREDTHVLAALFSNALGIIGGLVEMAVWLGWPILR